MRGKMTKRKTDEEFRSELLSINSAIIPLEPYINGRTKILCRCDSCGYEWSPTPNNLLQGSGCPKCRLEQRNRSFTKTNSVSLDQMASANPSVTPLEPYVTARTKLLCVCNVCGYQWSSMPYSLLQGKGCPRCGQSIKKTDEEFRDQLKAISPSITPIESYTGKNNPILCRCDSCGMEWKAYPGTLLGGSGCPSCARVRGTAKRTKSAEEFMAQLKSANPTVEMLEKYVNDRTKIKFRCLECGWEWKVSPGSLLRGTKCPSCTKNSTSFFEQSILWACRSALPGITVLGRTKEAIGVELDVYIPSLRVAFEPSSWFWHKAKIFNDKEKRRLCDEKGISLVTIYSKYPQEEKPPFHSRCIVAESALSSRDWTEVTEMTKAALMEAGIDCDLVGWVWVKEMAAKNNARMTTKEFVRILNGVNDRVEILGDYMSALDKLPCRCRDCGYEWFAAPNKLLYGRGCPKCAVRQRAEANRYTDEQFKALLAKKNPDIDSVDSYIDSRTRIRCRCRTCGFEWLGVPAQLLQGTGCRKCSSRRNAHISANRSRKTDAQFREELAAVHPSIVPVDSYVSRNTKMMFLCAKCGYKWRTTPRTALNGKGCPECRKSKEQ